jgi:hypothetical protein
MTEYEKQKLRAISELCRDFTRDKVHDLYSLAYHFSYMEMERNALLAGFKRYESLKREKTKEKAWSYVTDQVFRLKTIADSAIFCSNKTD